jgi:hypothetical protein
MLVEKIVTQLCIKKTTVQKITVEMQIKRFLEQIRDEVKNDEQFFSVTLYDDENVIEPVRAISTEKLNKVFDKYIK